MLRRPSLAAEQGECGLSPHPYEENCVRDWRHVRLKEIRNCILKFRATEEEKDRIMKKVDASDLSISEYLRRCALDKKIVAVNGLDDIARELRAIGNNLNQIARAVNSGYIQAVNLQETEEVLGQLWQSLNSLQQSVQ